MVCYVHDRRFTSKFHGYINQLRQSKKFTLTTLHKLPKLCCSCSEIRKNIDHTETEPLLTSLDINSLQLIALRYDLKRQITTEITSSSTFPDYTILAFPSWFETAAKDIVIKQFIIQLEQEVCSIQQMYHIDLEFVTSLSSKKLLSEVAQRKYDLSVTSSYYFEVSQAIDGLWVIISTKNSSNVHIMKHVLEKKWNRFIGTLHTVSLPQQNFRPTVRNNRYTNLRQSKSKYQQTSKQYQRKWQVKKYQQLRKISPESETYMTYSENEDDGFVEDFIEDVFSSTPSKLQFLSTRSDNCKEYKQARTHRRQHLLALAIVA